MTSPANAGQVNTTGGSSPDKRAVADFHRNSDLNTRSEAQHHDLGNGSNQASFGNHIHDGQRGIALLDGVTFTGSRTNNTADILNQIMNALVPLSATNATGT